MSQVQLATVLRGAAAFDENNVNDTYRGQVLIASGETRQAIIKDLNLVQLCNELIVHCLAREVGLPIPDCYLGLVRSGVLELKMAPTNEDDSKLVFVSVDVKVPNVTYRWTGSDEIGKNALISEIGNWKDLGHLYAFDAWVANVDRHMGNLLFGGNNEFWLIDHGHCFTGPNWSAEQLDPRKEYINRLSSWLSQRLTFEQKKQCAKVAQQFGINIDGFDATETSNNSHVTSLLPDNVVVLLKEFIERRTARVANDARSALGVPMLDLVK